MSQASFSYCKMWTRVLCTAVLMLKLKLNQYYEEWVRVHLFNCASTTTQRAKEDLENRPHYLRKRTKYFANKVPKSFAQPAMASVSVQTLVDVI